MKKLAFTFMGSVCILILAACSLDDIAEKVAPQAMGVLLYGDEELTDKTIKEHQDELIETLQWKVKVKEANEKNDVMILSITQAEEMMKSKLWNSVVRDDKTELVTEMSEPKEGEAILFAREADKNINPLSALETSYKGNIILGNGRTYVDMFLIVTDDEWDKIDAQIKTVGFLHFDEDENPKYKLNEFPAVEKAQLVSIP